MVKVFLTAFLFFAVSFTAMAEAPATQDETATVFGKEFLCINGQLHLKQGHYVFPVLVRGGKLGCPKYNQYKPCRQPNPKEPLDETQISSIRDLGASIYSGDNQSQR